jgi:type III restriction enzyme
LLGKAPKPKLDMTTPMLERVKRLPNLMVLNDEAHHVHDGDLAWNQTLLALHVSLERKGSEGLAAWLDFTATPENQNGTFFPWIAVDYPLAQAVEDRIVKTPLIIHQTDKKNPDKYAASEAGDVYNEWIAIAIERWREHVKDYGAVGEKPLLFVMAESTKDADSIAERLRREPEFKGKDRVLVIHTDKAGEITKKDLEAARQAARAVDEGYSRIRAIVSVLMLRESWDVRNVSVILGLRPFTAKATILPEQAIGRGLRSMRGVPRDNNQILELMPATTPSRRSSRLSLTLATISSGLLRWQSGSPGSTSSIYPARALSGSTTRTSSLSRSRRAGQSIGFSRPKGASTTTPTPRPDT